MDIKTDKKNNVLKRQEIEFEIESDSNPGFSEVKKQISKKFSKPEENIDILSLKGNFGKKLYTIHAHIYDSKEDLDEIKKLQRTKKQRKEQAEAKKAEAKSEESLKEPDKPEEPQ